jgi:hypothetical protein
VILLSAMLELLGEVEEIVRRVDALEQRLEEIAP